jgi:hypothetical protein
MRQCVGGRRVRGVLRCTVLSGAIREWSGRVGTGIVLTQPISKQWSSIPLKLPTLLHNICTAVCAFSFLHHFFRHPEAIEAEPPLPGFCRPLADSPRHTYLTLP